VERSPNIPRLQGEFIERAVSVLAADPRIVGVAAAGSYADNQMDEFSDVDLVSRESSFASTSRQHYTWTSSSLMRTHRTGARRTR
jgi:hypothetical protein